MKWNCCFDNDGAGNGFDVATAYYLKGDDCKAFSRTIPGDNFRTVFISFPNGQIQSWKEEEFSSQRYLSFMKMDNAINIIKTPKYKDWNELLRYYKHAGFNTGPGMKFIPAIEDTMSQLNLRGYHLLADMFQQNSQELIQSLIQRSHILPVSLHLQKPMLTNLLLIVTYSWVLTHWFPFPIIFIYLTKQHKRRLRHLRSMNILKRNVSIFSEI